MKYEVQDRAPREIAGVRVKAGDTLDLTPRQALFYLRIGALRAAKPKARRKRASTKGE